jgi:hypothetical protein
MSAEYKIHRWDAVIYGNSITKVPIIYIIPDIKFLEYVRRNNHAVMCFIKGTNTIYDDFMIPGVVNKSCAVPNCRPNFYEDTGFYVIQLLGTWNGYPDPCSLGTVSFKGLEDLTNSGEYTSNDTEEAIDKRTMECNICKFGMMR